MDSTHPIRPLLRLASQGISALEALCFGSRGPQMPPLFIAGLPRAGTTLVYQAICAACRVAYLPEFTSRFGFGPAFAAKACALLANPPTSFESRYGASMSLCGPGEGINWNLYFDKRRYYDDLSALPKSDARKLIATVGQIERIANGPFVNKNLRHMQRLNVLADLFPNALFLFVLRDPEMVAQSLLKGRKELYGDAHAMFSITPRNGYPTERTPEQDIAVQIESLLAEIETFVNTVSKSRCLALEYEQFCNSPNRMVMAVVDQWRQAGASVESLTELPDQFSIRRQPASQEFVQALQMHGLMPWPGDWRTRVACSWLGRGQEGETRQEG